MITSVGAQAFLSKFPTTEASGYDSSRTTYSMDITINGKKQSYSLNRAIKWIILPETVKSIGEDAFATAYLDSIVIGSDVAIAKGTDILHNSFVDFYNLNGKQSGLYKVKEDQSGNVGEIGVRTYFDRPKAIEFGLFTWEFQPYELTTDYYYTSDGKTATIIFYTGNDRNAVIPSEVDGIEVSAIGDMAFYRIQLKSVIIPAGVTTIGASAFMFNNFKSVELPSTVKKIGSNAFLTGSAKNDPSVTEFTITIGDDVSVGGTAFNVPLSDFYKGKGDTYSFVYDNVWDFWRLKEKTLSKNKFYIGALLGVGYISPYKFDLSMQFGRVISGPNLFERVISGPNLSWALLGDVEIGINSAVKTTKLLYSELQQIEDLAVIDYSVGAVAELYFTKNWAVGFGVGITGAFSLNGALHMYSYDDDDRIDIFRPVCPYARIELVRKGFLKLSLYFDYYFDVPTKTPEDDRMDPRLLLVNELRPFGFGIKICI
jgi:hypothetical protein